MRQRSDALHNVLWFTGFSGSGKSTLCRMLAAGLHDDGYPVWILDGDALRKGLCSDLGFEMNDRMENVRRIAHVAKLMSDQGAIVLVAVICPLESMRQIVRSILPGLIHVFVDAPLEVCERRDPKGLYKKARAGLLRGFTGIDSPFEPPMMPDVICRTAQESILESTAKVRQLLQIPQHNAMTTPALDYSGRIDLGCCGVSSRRSAAITTLESRTGPPDLKAPQDGY
jgi:adenylylsulfate kinase